MPASPVPPDALPAIPVVDAGSEFPRQTLEAEIDRAHALLDAATQGVPRVVLKGLDAVSRRWLVKSKNACLPEIDALAQRIGRPGGHFLSINYEWGCTVAVGPSPDGRTARLARTLDWFTPGLGRYCMAARVSGRAGPFVTMTWPGFVGALQAMAPGRFTAALNQAPLRRLGGGLIALDWAANKVRFWQTSHEPALHLLRRVMDGARSYEEARDMLVRTPIAAPATFSLAGTRPDEACVVERNEERAYLIAGPTCVTNHWHGLDHGGHPRGIDSVGRLAQMRTVGPVELDPAFPWLVEPVLNQQTRMAMVADAGLGRLVAQGFEHGRPATSPLTLSMPTVAVGNLAAE